MAKIIYKELDVYKGLSILFIIMLHSLCASPLNIREAESMQLMRSFISLVSPNALFFFASGFLFVKSSKKYSFRDFAHNKFKRLLIPMAVFGVLSIIIKSLASSFVNNPIENVYAAFFSIFIGKYYWFLYALFWMFIIHKCLGDKWRIFVTIVMGGKLMCCFKRGHEYYR